MRPIDADALDKLMGEMHLSLLKQYGCFDAYTMGYESAVCAVEAAPTIDAVPVVRCEDCKHFGGVAFAYTCRLHSTGNTRIQMGADDFCSHGEKRDE